MSAHRVTATALALAAVLGWWALLPGTGAGPGSDVARAAAPRYRFWTYWHRTGGSWAYADTGPSGYRPADGSVDGWRYEVTADGAARAPRTTATFAQICGSTPAVAGRSRVAIVFDYGTAGDARRGQHPPANRGACAVIVPGSTGMAALEAVATLRFRADGIICAFDDYPSSGCVDLVGQPAVPPAPPSPSSPSPSSPSPSSPSPSAPGPSAPGPSAPGSSASPRPTAHRTTRPTAKPSPRVTAEPTRTPARTTTPTSTPEPSTSTPTPTTPVPRATRAPSAPAARTSPPPASPRPTPPARATQTATATTPTSSTGLPSTSTAAPAPREPAGAAASAAGLILTGTSRPATGGVGPTTWAGLAALLLLAATAGVLAVRRRRSRHG